MNVSMYTNSHLDGLPVKVSTQQIGQLIEGEGPPRLTAWDCFYHFFLDLVCCACGGNRHASEQQLREIYLTLHPQQEEGMQQGGNIQDFMTAAEKLVELTDVPQRGDYWVHIGSDENGMCNLTLYFGSCCLAARQITPTEKVFLTDNCLCEENNTQGAYKLNPNMGPEERRRARLGDYEFMDKCMGEISQHGGRLRCKPPSAKLEAVSPFTLAEQQQTLGAFPGLQEFLEKQKNKNFGPKREEVALHQQFLQMIKLDRLYQGYRASCTGYNAQLVDNLLGHIYENHKDMDSVRLEITCRKIMDLLGHINKFGLYSEMMDREFIVSTTHFTWVLCKFTETKDKYPQCTAQSCEALLKVLDRRNLAKITNRDQHEYLVKWIGHLESEKLKAQLDKQKTLAAAAAAGQQNDGQTKSGARRKEQRASGGMASVLKFFKKTGKASGEGASYLPKPQKELLERLEQAVEKLESESPPQYVFPLQFQGLFCQTNQILEGDPPPSKEFTERYRLSAQKVEDRCAIYLSEIQEIKGKFDKLGSEGFLAPTPGMVSSHRRINQRLSSWPEGKYKEEAEKICREMGEILHRHLKVRLFGETYKTKS